MLITTLTLDCGCVSTRKMNPDLTTVGSVVRCYRCCKEVRVTDIKHGPDHAPDVQGWKLLDANDRNILVSTNCLCGDIECCWNAVAFQTEMYSNAPGILTNLREYLKTAEAPKLCSRCGMPDSSHHGRAAEHEFVE